MSKRTVQITLGVLWLLDGTLQLQHQMFTANFANEVIAPAMAGQPGFVRASMHFFIRIFLTNPTLWNSLIAITQLAIGIGLLTKRYVKQALVLSVAWGLFVWYIGEGFSGIFGGQASLIMGAPGSAILYVALALAAMPNDTESSERSRPASWLQYVWAVSWLGGAVYQLMPGQNSAASLSAMYQSMVVGTPAWLGSLYTHIASWLQSISNSNGHGFWLIILLASVEALIGLSIFASGGVRKVGLWVGILVACTFWVAGQGLGEYYTGLATDPNSGPLFVLMALSLVGLASPIRLGLFTDLEAESGV